MSLVFSNLQNKMKTKTKQISKSSASTKVAKSQTKQQKQKKNMIYESEDEFFSMGNLSDKQQGQIQEKLIQQTHKKEKIEKGKMKDQKQKKTRNSFPMNSRSKKSIPDGIIMFVINKLDIFSAKDKTWIESKLYEALKEKVLNTKNRYIMLCILINKIKSLNYLGTILDKRFFDIEKKKSLKLNRISQNIAHIGNDCNFDEYLKQVELLKCIWEHISTDINEESQILLSYIQKSAKTIFSHKGRQKTRTSNGISAIQNSKISQISSLISQLKKFDVLVKDDITDHHEEQKNQKIVSNRNNATRQLPIEGPRALNNQLNKQQSEDDQN